MCQIISGLVVLVASPAVAGTLHELLRFHIQFAQTVDDDMYMDIPASVASIRVCTDQRLVAREVFLCIFHTDSMRPFWCQATVDLILRVKADDIVISWGAYFIIQETGDIAPVF